MAKPRKKSEKKIQNTEFWYGTCLKKKSIIVMAWQPYCAWGSYKDYKNKLNSTDENAWLSFFPPFLSTCNSIRSNFIN